MGIYYKEKGKFRINKMMCAQNFTLIQGKIGLLKLNSSFFPNELEI